MERTHVNRGLRMQPCPVLKGSVLMCMQVLPSAALSYWAFETFKAMLQVE